MKIYQQKKFNQIGKDEKKKNQESFHQRKNVQSSQEKWKCIRKNENSQKKWKDKSASKKNANSPKKDESLSNWKKQKMHLIESQWNPSKKIKSVRLKTRKGSLGKS